MPKHRTLNIDIPAMSRSTGLHPSTLRSRLERGTSPENIFAPAGTLAKRLHKKYPAEYRIWARIKNRCKHPNRPPFMWRSWDTFETFINDVGPRPTPLHQLRLKDKSSRYYNPENVRWVFTPPRNPKLPEAVTGRLDWLLHAAPPEEE